MTYEVTLTQDEAEALADVLAMLAVIGKRVDQRDMIEISGALWRDMLLRPAQRLRRVGSRNRLVPR